MNFITRGDIYRLATRSNLESAQKFESWIYDEVIPSIHDNGAYITPAKAKEILADPRIIRDLAIKAIEAEEKCLMLEATITELAAQNEIMAPKAEYFDELVDRNLLINIRNTAKELGMKERVFINILLEQRYLYRDKKNQLMPYANKNNGLFEVKEYSNIFHSGLQTMVTPKGRETFRLLIKTA